MEFLPIGPPIHLPWDDLSPTEQECLMSEIPLSRYDWTLQCIRKVVPIGGPPGLLLPPITTGPDDPPTT